MRHSANSPKSGALWKVIYKQFRVRLKAVPLNIHERIRLLNKVEEMRETTLPQWRDAQLTVVVNTFLDEVEFLRNPTAEPKLSRKQIIKAEHNEAELERADANEFDKMLLDLPSKSEDL